ncbi:MAG: tetratricopeptide repeat protein, partial [Cyanobacteria bacterium SZAS LIN-2]|nr:tetratricopeptide repeat protein [Cyanobacteria bacterium SZAS LIN-2]
MRAINLLRAGQNEQAAKEAEAAFEEAKTGTNKDVLASCYALRAKIYRRQNKYDEALDAYQHALEHWESKPESEKASKSPPAAGFIIAMIYTNLGELRNAMGEPDKGLEYLKQAKAFSGEDLANYWAIQENTGLSYYHLKNYDLARDAFKDAAEKAKRGNDHRCEIDSTSNLAASYIKTGQKKEALLALEEAVRAISKYAGPNDQRIKVLQHLQDVTSAQDPSQNASEFDKYMMAGANATRAGDLTAAKEAYKHAVEEGEKLGADERFAVALSNLATATDHNKEPDKVIDLYKRSIKISEKLFGNNTVRLAEPLNAIAIILSEHRRYTEAKPYLKRGLPLLKEKLGDNDARYQQSAKLVKFIEL